MGPRGPNTTQSSGNIHAGWLEVGLREVYDEGEEEAEIKGMEHVSDLNVGCDIRRKVIARIKKSVELTFLVLNNKLKF